MKIKFSIFYNDFFYNDFFFVIVTNCKNQNTLDYLLCNNSRYPCLCIYNNVEIFYDAL